MTIKELKKGEFFTRKPVQFPKESQVLVRGDYNYSTRKYSCYHWDDICHVIELKGSTEIFTEFVF